MFYIEPALHFKLETIISLKSLVHISRMVISIVVSGFDTCVYIEIGSKDIILNMLLRAYISHWMIAFLEFIYTNLFENSAIILVILT